MKESVGKRHDAAARVFVLYTGGTIGMVPSNRYNKHSPLTPGDAESLSRYVRKPDSDIWWDISGFEDDCGRPIGPLDSSSIGPDHWKFMAAAIEKVYNDYDGFVILHGTDTMAYSASALSFLFQNLAKPVVFTGSQLPISAPRTDAVKNFTNALQVAGYKWSGVPVLAEVVICFGDALLRGNRTTKVSASRWQAFDTPNYPRLGSVGEHIVIDENLIRKPPGDGSPFFVHRCLEKNVAMIPFYPGMSADVLCASLSVRHIKGYILRTFGAGNAPADEQLQKLMLEAIVNDNKILVNTTQCLEGAVEMGLYEASSGLQSAGVLTGLDLTPEAALTKLMWLLANIDPNDAAAEMQIDQRGEQTGSVFDVKYGSIDSYTNSFSKSARPSDQFRTRSLKQAILRIQGISFRGALSGNNIKIHVFIDLIDPMIDLANDKTPQYAGALYGQHEIGNIANLSLDITSTIKTAHDTGRSLQLSLLTEDGCEFQCEGVFITLFNT